MKRNLEICNNSNKYVFTIVSLRIDLSWFIFLKTFLSLFLYCLYRICRGTSLLAEVSHDEAKMRERRETSAGSFLSFLPRRERPLLAGNRGTQRGYSSKPLNIALLNVF